MNRRHFAQTVVACAGGIASTKLLVQHPLERGGTFRNEHFVIQRPLDLFRPVLLECCDMTIDGGCLNIWKPEEFAWFHGICEVLAAPEGKGALNFMNKGVLHARYGTIDFPKIHIGQIRPHYA